MGGSRVMALGRDDSCVRCGVATPAGTKAFWDATARHVLCIRCHDADLQPVVAVTPLPPPKPIDVGVAGGGARVVSQQLAARGRAQSQSKWEKGAIGEEHLGALLDRDLPEAICLHDRKLPGSSANVDHIVVTEQFVCVVDAKNWRGLVERRDKGRGLKLDDRLYVGGRDQTDQVRAMDRQIDAVRAVLEPMGFAEFPIRTVVCFVNAEWPVFGRSFFIDGVLVTSPKRLIKRIKKDKAPARGAATLQAVSNALSAQLVAATPTA